MPEQLKIIIDADVQGAIAGVQNLSRVITSDFVKATNTASIAASNLSNEVTASVQKINASLSGLKVTSLDVSVNTSSVDASIKNIQSKFAALVDPQINVLANTAQAETQIKELLGELSALKSSQVFITANDSQALSVINEVEAELKGILDKQIKINVNATGITDVTQRINALEKSLINLEALKVTPDISSTQLQLFESNIQRVKAEIASLKSQALVVPIGVDVKQAQASVNTLSESIETLRARAEAKKIFITTETDITKIAAYNKEIQSLEAQVRRLQNVGKKGFELFVVPNQAINSVKNLTAQVAAFGGGVKTFIPPAIAGFKQLPSTISPVINQLKSLEAQSLASGASLGKSFNSAFQSVRQLANILPGIGIAGIFGVAITAVTELTASLFKATQAAIKHSDALEGASDEYAHAIANVNELRTNIDLAKQGLISKDAVVKQYNESIGKTTGLVQNLDQAEKELGKNAQAYVKFTLLKAAANFALEEASKKAVKAALIPSEDIKKNLSFLERLNLPFEKAPSRKSQEQKFLQPVIAGVQKEQEEFEKIAEDFQKKAAQIAKEMGFSFFSDFKIDKTKLKDETDDVLARARQFVKEFGDVFVVPDLTESFFKTTKDLLPTARKLLDDVSKGNLKIRIPVQSFFDFIPEVGTPLTDAQLQELTKGFFEGIRLEKEIPLDITFDPTLAPGSIEKIKKIADLKDQFKVLGGLGLKEFDNIFKGIASTDFEGLNKGIADATQKLKGMMEIANTLNQAIGSGLVNAFNSVFDSILEGKSVFKALGEAIKQLVVGTIKAIAQMLILKAITNLIFPGGGGAISGLVGTFGRQGQANFGGFGGIGTTAFQNVLTVNVVGQISGSTINLAGQRAANSSGRFG